MKKPVLLSVVGYANSGKTTFLEGLLPQLASRGLRVAVIKHHGHPDSDLKKSGKDTGRFARSGANPVGLVQGNRVSMEYVYPSDPEPKELVSLVPSVDLLITEGFKRSANPKIEVWRHQDQAAPACQGDSNLIALITCREYAGEVPVFALDDYIGVADFIVKFFRLS